MEGARTTHPRRILVATDFSTAADAAFDRAVDLAAALDGYVVLLHVVELATPRLPESLAPRVRVAVDHARHAAGQALAAEVDKRRARGVPMSVVIAEGTPWRAIVDAARQEDMDLVVLATQGASSGTHLLGGVAERVVRAAPCPVLTVPFVA